MVENSVDTEARLCAEGRWGRGSLERKRIKPLSEFHEFITSLSHLSLWMCPLSLLEMVEKGTSLTSLVKEKTGPQNEY